jgi:hypothetical protein
MEKKQLTDRKTSVLNDETPRCKFIVLPAELRNRIYRLTLLEPDAIKINDSSKPQEPSLLSACRQITQEAISIYYGEIHFDLRVTGLDPTTAQKWLSGSTLRPESKHTTRLTIRTTGRTCSGGSKVILMARSRPFLPEIRTTTVTLLLWSLV